MCRSDVIVTGLTGVVSTADALDSDECREVMRSSDAESWVRRFARKSSALASRLTSHGQLGTTAAGSSNDSAYCGRDVHSGLHRHCLEIADKHLAGPRDNYIYKNGAHGRTYREDLDRGLYNYIEKLPLARLRIHVRVVAAFDSNDTLKDVGNDNIAPSVFVSETQRGARSG